MTDYKIWDNRPLRGETELVILTGYVGYRGVLSYCRGRVQSRGGYDRQQDMATASFGGGGDAGCTLKN